MMRICRLCRATTGLWQGRMLRTHRHKYLAFDRGHKKEMLFDLDLDPLETVDQAEEPSYENAKNELRRRLSQWCRQTDDDFEC